MTAREELYGLLAPLGIYKLRCGSRIDWELESYLTVLEPARQALDTLLREAFLCTAREGGLRRWETLLELPPILTGDPAARRGVLSALLWQNRDSARPAGFLRLLAQLGLTAQLQENTGAHSCTVWLQESQPLFAQIAQCQALAAQYLPAGISCSFVGRGKSWAQLDELARSWNEMDQQGLSWEELDTQA